MREESGRRARPRDRRTRSVGLPLFWLAALLAAAGPVLAVLAGCTAPTRATAPGGRPPVYVVNSGDGTISRIDSEQGRVVGAPLPAGPSPAAVVPGPAGSLLIIAFSPQGAGRVGGVTQISPAGAGWSTRPVPLGAPARAALLAGDGGRFAAVAYQVAEGEPGTPRCRLAVVDAAAGSVARTHTVCSGRELITGLALETGLRGTVAYLGIWGWQAGPDGHPIAAGGRLAAVDVHSAAVLAVVRLPSAPGSVVVAPAPGRIGRRVYLVEASPGAESEYAPAGRWRVLGLDPGTLAVESEHTLAYQPRRLAVSDDGDHVYALSAAGDEVGHLDLTTGTARRLATLPGEAVDLAVAGDAIYVPNPYGSEVWMLDRGRGRLVRRIPVGRHPTAIVAAAAP